MYIIVYLLYAYIYMFMHIPTLNYIIYIYIHIYIIIFGCLKLTQLFFQNEEFPSSSYLAKQLMWIYGCYEWQKGYLHFCDDYSLGFWGNELGYIFPSLSRQ